MDWVYNTSSGMLKGWLVEYCLTNKRVIFLIGFRSEDIHSFFNFIWSKFGFNVLAILSVFNLGTIFVIIVLKKNYNNDNWNHLYLCNFYGNWNGRTIQVKK